MYRIQSFIELGAVHNYHHFHFWQEPTCFFFNSCLFFCGWTHRVVFSCTGCWWFLNKEVKSRVKPFGLIDRSMDDISGDLWIARGYLLKSSDFTFLFRRKYFSLTFPDFPRLWEPCEKRVCLRLTGKSYVFPVTRPTLNIFLLFFFYFQWNHVSFISFQYHAYLQNKKKIF